VAGKRQVNLRQPVKPQPVTSSKLGENHFTNATKTRFYTHKTFKKVQNYHTSTSERLQVWRFGNMEIDGKGFVSLQIDFKSPNFEK